MTVPVSVPDQDEVFRKAVPHESGHVLVAYRLGVPVKHISIQVRSEVDGNVVSVIQYPREDEMPHLSERERSVYCQVLAGGIAGERFATSTIDPLNGNPSSGDNLALRRFTDSPLTDFEAAASAIINGNRRAFRQLCSKLL